MRTLFVRRCLLLACGVVAPMLSAHAASDPLKPAAAIASIMPLCASCHGSDGVSANGLYPNLAGQKSAYLVKQLNDFKTKRRDDPVMGPMSESLSDDIIEALATHFAGLPAAR